MKKNGRVSRQSGLRGAEGRRVELLSDALEDRQLLSFAKMATASTTAVAQQAVDTTLVSLIDDHLTHTFSFLKLEDLIHASSACISGTYQLELMTNSLSNWYRALCGKKFV